MINYQSKNPVTNFIMLDRGTDDDLSPDAYYLLIKLMKLAPMENNSNAALKQKTGFGKTRFDNAKAELAKKCYLDTKQLFGNKYALYIGRQSVQQYRKKYKKSENRYEQNQIIKVKKNIDGHKNQPSKF